MRADRTYFGTATSKVSMNSEFSTKSPFFTTSKSNRCDKLPLLHQLIQCRNGRTVAETHCFFLCRLFRPPFARLYDCVFCFCC